VTRRWLTVERVTELAKMGRVNRQREAAREWNGDYPLFDFVRRFKYRAKRQVGVLVVVLGCLIGIVGVVPERISTAQGAVVDRKPDTVCCAVGIGIRKNVAIFAVTEENNIGCARTHAFHLFSRDLIRSADRTSRADSATLLYGDWERRSDSLASSWNLDKLRAAPYVHCGRIPGIRPYDRDLPCAHLLIGGALDRPCVVGAAGNVSALADDKRFLGYLRANFGSSGRFRSVTERDHQNERLGNQGKELQSGNPSENLGVISKLAIELDQLPIKFRFFLALFCVLGGLALSIRGGLYLYDDRRLIGTELLVGGLLLGLFGVGLGLAPFPIGWGL